MTAPANPTMTADDERLGERASLVRDDPMYRAQRRVGLIPGHGFGTGRRVLFFMLVTWAPIAVWSVLGGGGAADGEPFVRHFGVHVRCLLAIPLFIMAEPMLHERLRTFFPQLVRTGIVDPTLVPRLVAIVDRVARLRERSVAWVVIAGLIVAMTVADGAPHDVNFAIDGAAGLGFGGWWFVYVSRPIFLIFALGWLWRVGLVAKLFRDVAALPLAIVPTHPDRVGGLQFLERITLPFAPVALALSAVVSSRWAHDELYHGVLVPSLQGPIVTLVVLVVLILLSPLLVFTPMLAATKRAALLEYGTLVGTHGRLVRRRWIAGEAVDDDRGLLSAPELGPVADTVALYEAVERMRPVLIGVPAVAPILIATAIPILAALSLQVPLKDLLLKVLNAVA